MAKPAGVVDERREAAGVVVARRETGVPRRRESPFAPVPQALRRGVPVPAAAAVEPRRHRHRIPKMRGKQRDLVPMDEEEAVAGGAPLGPGRPRTQHNPQARHRLPQEGPTIGMLPQSRRRRRHHHHLILRHLRPEAPRRLPRQELEGRRRRPPPPQPRETAPTSHPIDGGGPPTKSKMINSAYGI